jgi:hypothetical protein
MDFTYGTLTDTPPANFAPPESWSEFGALAYPAAIAKREVVGTNPRGVRMAFGPLCFEEYVSDTEPDLIASKQGALARNRVVLWRRILKTDIPKGWIPFSSKPWRIDGYHTLVPGVDYSAQWDKDTRRNLRTWRTELLGKKYTVEEISFDEFALAYKDSATAKKIRLDQLNSVVRKYALPEVRKHMTFLGVRNNATKQIIAGTAVFYFPTKKASVRECPFAYDEARHCFAMTGLMDHWFAYAQKLGAELLLFTHFWHKGEPKEWKGFSEFKSHFNLTYVAYPPLLVKFVPGKLF